jgi:hypothetical protein
MFDLPMPAPYDGWDPLLQRYVVASDNLPRVFCPTTPASTIAAASGGSKTPATPNTGGSAVLMPPPPPRMAAGRPSSFGAIEPSSTPSLGVTAPAGTVPPQTPEEISEAQSLALALQLQQEEHSAFMQAVRVSSPAPQSVASGAHGGGEPMVDDDMDESLQLAMQLQQEELQWHAAAAGTAAGAGGEALDEDMRLAMRLAAEQDEGH